MRETAALLADVLRELRDEGLLTVDVLQAMPLDAMRFQPGTMFRPVFDSTRAVLLQEDLIPVTDGGYRSAPALKLARGRRTMLKLLPPQQLGELYGADHPFAFAHDSITENRTALLGRYLREEIGVDEVTPEVVVTRITRDFLAAQSDAWMARFYTFLHQNPACGGPSDSEASSSVPPGQSRLSGLRAGATSRRSTPAGCRPPTSPASRRRSSAKWLRLSHRGCARCAPVP